MAQKYWNGSEWVVPAQKVWDGTQWADVGGGGAPAQSTLSTFNNFEERDGFDWFSGYRRSDGLVWTTKGDKISSYTPTGTLQQTIIARAGGASARKICFSEEWLSGCALNSDTLDYRVYDYNGTQLAIATPIAPNSARIGAYHYGIDVVYTTYYSQPFLSIYNGAGTSLGNISDSFEGTWLHAITESLLIVVRSQGVILIGAGGTDIKSWEQGALNELAILIQFVTGGINPDGELI